ncbi:unnamed protein product [Adineta ricciae]|nr:unnamed protein product [Adineta ricciae]
MKFKAAVNLIKFVLKLLPIKKWNYIHIIRQHYGSLIGKNVFLYGKYQLKLSKTKLDLDLLRTCKREKIIPDFVRFKIPSTHQHHRQAINNCYEQMVIHELKLKKCKLSRLYRIIRNFKTLICLDLNHLHICRVERIIHRIVASKELEIKESHQNKLNKFRNKQRPASEPNKSTLSPITNLSKRILTDKEISILENGLNFVLPADKFDEMTFISNIETFFVELLGHCTDKRDYEEKDVDEEIKYNLTPIQLQYANKIRSVCNNFRHNADKVMTKHKHESVEFKRILNDLSKDKSILIARPDKGKGIVIIDKEDYNNKMLQILNDRNTFEIVEVDETITQEDRLMRKLKQLRNEGFITEKEFNFCRPRGSQPARIYGLPKIHKLGAPLRPIVSASGTFNYKLAKLLANKLDYLRKNESIIKDTFTFVDELRSLKFDNSRIKLISFDITSLFTNVPLNRTIQIILDKMYGSEHTCTYSSLKRDDWCRLCKNRYEMKYLLETSTKETEFIFNNKIYSQINGIAMGSPLGPLFADIYVNYLEERLWPRLKRNGLLYWRRYVDDTFAIVEKDANVEKIIDILNSFDNYIVFTFEEENNNTLPFLDIHITKLPNNVITEDKYYHSYNKSTNQPDSKPNTPLTHKSAENMITQVNKSDAGSDRILPDPTIRQNPIGFLETELNWNPTRKIPSVVANFMSDLSSYFL